MSDRRLTPPRAAATLLAVLLLATAPSAVRAQAPAALVNPVFAFPLPGDYVGPANAASAGLALADRWLGAGGYENPALFLPSGLEASPVFQRVNRQDVASENRDYDQVVGYPDLAGARLTFPAGGFGLAVYGWQPVLRMEEFSFTTGPLQSPAFLRFLTSQREIRAGASVSHPVGAARVGVAGEWVRRDDAYETHEQSGGTGAGDRRFEMSGDGFGGSAGVSWEKDPDREWGSWFGAAVHYTSELTLSGTAQDGTPTGSFAGDTTFAFDLTREAEWSGGLSGRITVAPATRVVVGFSFRSGADWQGLGRGTGTGVAWSTGLDWKDEELPWGVRFGLGQETSDGAVESKAGLLSVGFTWVSGDLALDAGILHRNLARGDRPRSSDDRGVLSVRIAF